MPQFIDVKDDDKRGLSGYNKCVLVGAITDAVMAANPNIDNLYNAVAANPLLTQNTELRQARDMLGLRGLSAGKNEGILTATMPNTVLATQQLFIAQDDRLNLNYQGSCPQ